MYRHSISAVNAIAAVSATSVNANAANTTATNPAISAHAAKVAGTAAVVQTLSLPELQTELSKANATTIDTAMAPADALITSLNPLHQIKARIQVCAGTAVISVGELLALRAHQVLTLDQGIEEPVDLLLDGQVIARGQLVAVDDCFGVRITELPIALQT